MSPCHQQFQSHSQIKMQKNLKLLAEGQLFINPYAIGELFVCTFIQNIWTAFFKHQGGDVMLYPEVAESTITTISLIVVFPITFSNYFSKISKEKVKNVPNDSKQCYTTGLIHRKVVPLLMFTLYWLSDVLH